MTESEGWLFSYNLYKIHYFVKGVSLCGRVTTGPKRYGQNICKPITLNENDSRSCKHCVFILGTYSDLKNRL